MHLSLSYIFVAITGGANTDLEGHLPKETQKFEKMHTLLKSRKIIPLRMTPRKHLRMKI